MENFIWIAYTIRIVNRNNNRGIIRQSPGQGVLLRQLDEGDPVQRFLGFCDLKAVLSLVEGAFGKPTAPSSSPTRRSSHVGRRSICIEHASEALSVRRFIGSTLSQQNKTKPHVRPHCQRDLFTKYRELKGVDPNSEGTPSVWKKCRRTVSRCVFVRCARDLWWILIVS